MTMMAFGDIRDVFYVNDGLEQDAHVSMLVLIAVLSVMSMRVLVFECPWCMMTLVTC